MPKIQFLVGSVFERVKVLHALPRGFSLCQCQCGTIFKTRNDGLKSGTTKSCGCLRRERFIKRNTVHGKSSRKGSRNRTYDSWCAMKTRCTNPDNPQWNDYGGRGITVCKRWRESFENFLADMGECPPRLEIDRWPNNDGNYEPGNCRWATRKESSRNKRSNRIFTVRGIRACLIDLCTHFNCNYKRVITRLNRGWTIEHALFVPWCKGRKIIQ